MGVKLAYRYFGGKDKPPLLILHGLLGSSRNWTTLAKALAVDFEVFAVDLRNHGDSQHTAGMDFAAMAEDVVAFLDEQNIQHVHLIGHSLGGKVAMRVAMDVSARIESLTVVDIAPKAYQPHYLAELNAMRALQLEAITSRKEAEGILEQSISDWSMRQFLLTNLKRDADRGFYWSVHLETIFDSIHELTQNPLSKEESFSGPTLFLIGGASNFVSPEDHMPIRKYFNKVHFYVVESSGHNPHIEAKEEFLEAYAQFQQLNWGTEI